RARPRPAHRRARRSAAALGHERHRRGRHQAPQGDERDDRIRLRPHAGREMSALPRRRALGDDETPDARTPLRPPPTPMAPVVAVKHRGAITVSIMLATIMQALDSTIANVALPHMQGSLSAASDTITWVLTSYIIAAAIMTPMAGWLSGRFGRKQVFLVAVAGFTVASM